VRQILAGYAVGSLQPEVAPGSVVIPDQLVDRTTGRPQTYVDRGAAHIGFADPYCSHGRATVLAHQSASAQPIVPEGTMVVVDGPRFSTRAESQWYSRQGWAIINMTGHPEAALARELSICFTSVALVTDRDAQEAHASVSQEEVFARFRDHATGFARLLLAAASALTTTGDCACAHANTGFVLPSVVPEL
jgi:5'-methylthioadenosine phosphorylase